MALLLLLYTLFNIVFRCWIGLCVCPTSFQVIDECFIIKLSFENLLDVKKSRNPYKDDVCDTMDPWKSLIA